MRPKVKANTPAQTNKKPLGAPPHTLDTLLNESPYLAAALGNAILPRLLFFKWNDQNVEAELNELSAIDRYTRETDEIDETGPMGQQTNYDKTMVFENLAGLYQTAVRVVEAAAIPYVSVMTPNEFVDFLLSAPAKFNAKEVEQLAQILDIPSVQLSETLAIEHAKQQQGEAESIKIRLEELEYRMQDKYPLNVENIPPSILWAVLDKTEQSLEQRRNKTATLCLRRPGMIATLTHALHKLTRTLHELALVSKRYYRQNQAEIEGNTFQ